MLKINLDKAETLVDRRNDLSWDGWTIVQHVPHAGGWLRKDGAFDRATGRWMVATRFEVQPDGLYHIPRSFGRDL